MEDENGKEENQPSASKKESQRDSDNDVYVEKGNYEERRTYDKRNDGVSVSESFTTDTDSVADRSGMDVTEANLEIPKPLVGKAQVKPERKKRAKRRNGRVEKKHSLGRRQVLRRIPKRRQRERKEIRDLSVSTMFTTSSRNPCCKHCGHRCCRRRFQDKAKRRNVKSNKTKKIGKRMLNKRKASYAESKSDQAGSRSMMLSPLFINTNALPTLGELPEVQKTWCEISPEMIHEAVEKLTMWKQFAPTSAIMDYIKRNYPVCTEENELLEELTAKLHLAVIAGILTQVAYEHWCLCCDLQNRELTKNHVTRFWQAYGDTMSPVLRKMGNIPTNKDRGQEQANKMFM
ncbi:uncharacterized protein LOC131852415 [Achroia grisella]|uniref:uncharacterized protein LOC131852415 n=1 Tax=Achroia grisella TaxID=688607 RepID=UPI0027D21B14|nr:uncharacterized protein LOC131852415 [Achroia grisella]